VYSDCFAFFNEWIFTIADIVRYGIDYVNDGTTLTQMDLLLQYCHNYKMDLIFFHEYSDLHVLR